MKKATVTAEVKVKVPCLHCGKEFIHVNKHIPSCPENPDGAKKTGRVTEKPRTNARTPPARSSSSTTPTPEGQKEACPPLDQLPHCEEKTEVTSEMRESCTDPKPRADPASRESSVSEVSAVAVSSSGPSTSDKDKKEMKGKVPCPHCGKEFIHVNKHIPSCPENPDGAKKTGRVTEKPRTNATTPPALATHEGQKEACPSSDQLPDCEEKAEVSSEVRETCTDPKPRVAPASRESSVSEVSAVAVSSSGPSTSDKDKKEMKDKVPCPHCGKEFIHVNKHIPSCPENPDGAKKKRGIRKADEKAVREEKAQVPCPYCGQKYIHVRKHIPSCPKNPDKPKKTVEVKGKLHTSVSQDGPGVNSSSRTASSVPENSPSVPEESPSVRKDSPVLCSCCRKASSVVEFSTSVPEDNQSVPEDNQSVPEDSLSVPENSPSMPEDVPSAPEERTLVLGDIPPMLKDSQNVPEDSVSILEYSPSVPEDSPSELEDSPSVLEDSRSMPKDSPSVPKDSPSVHKGSSSVLEESESASKERPHYSPLVPADSPSVPVESPSIPEECPSATEDRQKAPQDSLSVLEKSPSIPEDSPTVPKDSASVPKDCPSAPKESPSVPKESQSVPEDSKSLLKEGQWVKEDSPSVPEDSNVEGSRRHSASSATGSKVKVTKDDIAEGSKVLNQFKEHIIERLNTVSKPIRWTMQSAGSYYDRTKIGNVDEFDLVLLATISCDAEFETSGDNRGYCRLRPHNGQILTSLTDSNGYLCPRKFREFAIDKLTMAVDETTVRLNRRIKRLHRPEDCPAFTVDYDCGNGKHLDIDLVPAIPMTGWPSISDWSIPSWASSVINRNELKKGYECVTKWHPTERDKPLWHVSFTKCSQLLWKHADGKEKTCRKLTLKVFKLKLDELKERTVVKHITSHQLRHCLFKAFDEHQEVQYWAERNKGTCITDVRNLIIQCFKDRKLDNYFVQGYNLLRSVPENETKCFVDHLMQNTSHNL